MMKTSSTLSLFPLLTCDSPTTSFILSSVPFLPPAFESTMSFISDRPTRAKGLSISIQEVNDIKSLPRLPTERSTSSSKESRGCLQTFYRYECDTWAWEIFNIILSLAALATVIVALRHYDGKAAPEWPYSLTLNAFVSVCMMVMGATLTVPVSNGLGQLKWLMAKRGKISVVDLDTLDRASRGMWGSVCTIFTWSGGSVAFNTFQRSY